MYARIHFENNQKITRQDLRILENTVSDTIDVIDMVEVVETGEIESFSSWRHSYDLIQEESPDKKKLVRKSEFVMLHSNKEYFADLELFMSKHPDIKISIRGLPPTVDRDYSTIVSEIVRVNDKLQEALKRFDKNVEFNEKCDVHISNMGILQINEVALLEDGCTDELQEALNKGWRIITAQPQPNQRRADYILGRYNPEMDIKKSKAVRI